MAASCAENDFITISPIGTCWNPCPGKKEPQCGSDGRTYRNPCVLKIAQCLAKKKGRKLILVAKKACKGNQASKASLEQKA